MNRFKKILVNLALDDQDEALLAYAGKVAVLSGADKIYVVHVSGQLDIPEEIRAQYPAMLEPADEFIASEMKEKVKSFLDAPGTVSVDVDVYSGNPLDEILKLAARKDIDLLVTGRKPEVKESGSLAEKLTRKAPCSVLTVTCCTIGSFERILLPVDFSENSLYALDVASAWASAAGSRSLDILNVYRVPAGFHKTGKSYDEFAEIMKKNAAREYEKFIKDTDLRGVEASPHFLLNDNFSRGILQAIDERFTDLVVMASRGRSGVITSLLGSATERILSQTDVPLLAVKQKGSGIGLLKLLLEI